MRTIITATLVALVGIVFACGTVFGAIDGNTQQIMDQLDEIYAWGVPLVGGVALFFAVLLLLNDERKGR